MFKWEKLLYFSLLMRISMSKVNYIFFLNIKPIISIAITVYEETRTWAVAGDQVLLTLIGVDISKTR